MNAIMLDMEFLDTTPSAAILSIGAVEMNFDTLTIGRKFYIEVSSEDCVRHGMTISPDTVRFWAEENHGELVRLISEGRSSLRNALDELFTFYRDVQRSLCEQYGGDMYPEVWSCGSLDIAIINHAVQLLAKQNLQRDIPWNFWNERDFRTMRSEFNIDYTPDGQKHNALNDALNQANHLFEIKRYLQSPVPVSTPAVQVSTPAVQVTQFSPKAFNEVLGDICEVGHKLLINDLEYVSGSIRITRTHEIGSEIKITSDLTLKEV